MVFLCYNDFIIFYPPKSHIHLIARGLLLQGKNIILCHSKNKDWFFLPGGHIENGESSKDALLRELDEEIGKNDYAISSFIGICENKFSLDKNTTQQELNIIFEVMVPENLPINTKEKDIDFIIIKQEEIYKYKILPEKIKDGIQEWIKIKKPFLKEL